MSPGMIHALLWLLILAAFFEIAWWMVNRWGPR